MTIHEMQNLNRATIEYVSTVIVPGMTLVRLRKLCEAYMLSHGADSFWYWDVGAFVFAGDKTAVSVYEHKSGQINGFTQKYHIHKLVYFEEYTEVNYAIAREKQLKNWVRSKKNRLIETQNPNWNDWGETFI